MKRVKFKLSNGETATGWQTSTPGLVAYRYPGSKLWALYHAPTGRYMAHFFLRDTVEKVARALVSLADWTTDVSRRVDLVAPTATSIMLAQISEDRARAEKAAAK